MSEFEKLEVGQKYPSELFNGVYLDYDNIFTLYLFLPNLTKNEIDSIRNGKYRFALTEISNMLVFLYEFKNGILLSDTPFHFSLSKRSINDLPNEIDTNAGFGLNVIAVDSATGIVQALRLITLGERFSNKLLEICKNQYQNPVDPTQHYINVQNLQSRYQAKQLLKYSSVICKG